MATLTTLFSCYVWPGKLDSDLRKLAVGMGLYTVHFIAHLPLLVLFLTGFAPLTARGSK